MLKVHSQDSGFYTTFHTKVSATYNIQILIYATVNVNGLESSLINTIESQNKINLM